ncbi:MAG: hypothetical protein ACJ77C_12145 [Chloroflexota bacterium]
MIRNVVLHMNNEQPLIADLFDAPSPGDVGLRCTNLRQLNGKRPVFVDDMKSVFFFPYLHVRFVEIPPAALAGADSSLATIDDDAADTGPRAGDPTRVPEPEPEPDLEIDEDFLRRIREA